MTRSPPPEPHVELYLAGDFSSPAEVLARNGLTRTQKREILEVWQRDLNRQPETRDTRELLASVRDAFARLDAEKE